MEIEYLKKLGFSFEENIEELKISKGKVAFNEKAENSKIIEPDLRYFWDGEKFGLHVSDDTNSGFDWLNFLESHNEKCSKAVILYFGRSGLQEFSNTKYDFPSLDFLYLSENIDLMSIEVRNLQKLETFEASHCLKLKKVDFTGSFNRLKWIDLSYSNLNTFSLQNAEFPDLHNINMTQNTFRNKGDFTFHTAPNLHYVYGLGEFPGIDKGFFEGNDLNVRRFKASESIKEIEYELNEYELDNSKQISLENNYQLNNDDFIHFLDLGHLDIGDLPEKLFEISTLEHLCLGAYYPDKLNWFGYINWQKSYYHEKIGNNLHTLNFNSFTSAELVKLKNLPYLKSLYLNSINLDSLDFVKNFPRLQSLDVSGNFNLVDFKELKTLKELKLFHASSIPGFNDSQTKFIPHSVISLSLENCRLSKILFLRSLKKMKFLSVRNNVIQEIDLSKMEHLEYLLANGNPISKLEWPTEFSSIKVFQIDESENINETLSALVNVTEEKLRDQLNSYIRQLIKGGVDTIMRVKLIFLGNTTVGKSTLRRILLSNEGEESKEASNDEDSTHGVTVFTKYFDFSGTNIYVQGFDFGGQDYYHATHLPFISHNALNILVYGFLDKPYETFNINGAYQFGINQNKDGSEEVTYPINYWIGSLKKNKVVEFDSELELGIFLKHTTYEGKKYEKDGLTVTLHKKPKVLLGETRVELIQNVRDENKFQELNSLEIKQTSGISVRDNISFNFIENAKVVKEWLLGKIYSHATTSSFLYSDKKLIEWLEKQKNVIFTAQEIFNSYKNDDYESEKELNLGIQRIHSHNFGYYFEPKDSNIEPFFINKVQDFSEWIHEYVLNKDLIKSSEGYFEISNLKLGAEAKGHQKRILSFLEENNVIFRIKNIDIEKWVAPSYLPYIQTKTEELLIDSFETPDCVFEFEGFFHSNIILMLIDKFQEDLILDVSQKEYLLWKNKVIFHQKADKNSKAYLLIELKYPGEKDFSEAFPQLSISRNFSGFVSDSNFQTVFEFVNENLKEFKPKISIKTRFGDYIPYECLFQENTLDGKLRSNLIFYNETIYSSFDFRHFSNRINSEPTKIFIGYSKDDIEFVNELLLHFGPYINQGELVVFYDKEMQMGDKWDEELKQQLITSDIFVCLVSPNMLNTKYVIDLELPLAHKNKLEIVPVILLDCNWTYLKLNNGINLLSENNAYAKADALPSNSYERHIKWKEIAEKLSNKSSKSNGSNSTNSSASPDEHLSRTDKTNV